MKDPTSTLSKVFLACLVLVAAAGLTLCLFLFGVGVGVVESRQQRAVSVEKARIAEANRQTQEWISQGKPKVTARNVKPSKDRAAAAPEELEALDLMREGKFEEAGKILDELANKPEPWLINLRKRAGATNPEAPVGPSWDEIEAWAKEHEAERGKESKP